MKKNKKLIAIISCMILLIGAVGATIAWLTDKTNEVVNTFTVGDINIDLNETKTDFKMIPGSEIDKDPYVTVKAGSEACWVFVEVTESENFNQYLTYHKNTDGTIKWADGWTVLVSATTNGKYVLYRSVDSIPTSDIKCAVLYNDEVIVLDTVTKAMMNAIDGVMDEGQTSPTSEEEIAKRPTLTFKAYAIQKENIPNVEDAWTKITE